MLTEERIVEIILGAMHAANASRTPEDQLDVSPAAVLFGPGSPLDSLGLVGILIDIEDALRDAGVEIALSDERAMSQRHSPFRSVPSLAGYIRDLVVERV